MSFTFENRADRILETKKKYEHSTPEARREALDTLFQMAKNFESQFDLGLIEWETLASLRGQTNATVQGLLELLHDSDQIDLKTCQTWKKHHPSVWMFIDEPRYVTEAVHRQFLTILGDITKKNPLLKSLAIQLSRHNWDSMITDKASERAQQESLRGIDDLSSQLKINRLHREVDILWDYYAPPAKGKTPSYGWLTDYVPPTAATLVAANVASSVSSESVQVSAEDAPPADFFEGLDDTGMANTTTLPGTQDTLMDDGPVYDQDDLDLLAGM